MRELQRFVEMPFFLRVAVLEVLDQRYHELVEVENGAGAVPLVRWILMLRAAHAWAAEQDGN